MQFKEKLCQFNFLRGIERGSDPIVDRRFHRPVHVGIGVTQNTRTDPHHAHVDVGLAVQVRDFRPSCFCEI